MLQLLFPLLANAFLLDINPAAVNPPQTPGQGGQPGGGQGGQPGGGQRRRGGIPGGSAPGGDVPPAVPATMAPGATGPALENVPWVRTKHTITINGTPIAYTATCGYLPVKDGNGEVQANMFFVEYTKDGADLTKRPVTFAFNGGPGSSSMWLHMGTIGPRRAKMNDDGTMPAPPFHVVDNEETWLPATDIVMLDAIGTGYSRTKLPTNRSYYGVQGDLEGFTAAIKAYLGLEHRWASPKIVAGESYGGIRVAGLSDTLLEAGIAVNGIISISGVMNEATLSGGRFNDLNYLSFLPSEAAVAWYHKKLAPKYENMPIDTFLAEVDKFTMGEYAAALNAGTEITPKEETAVIDKLSAYTGISKEYYRIGNLRIRAFSFMAELLKDKKQSVGRYDGRLIGRMTDGTQGRPDYDASDAAVSPVFISAFNQYAETELKFSPANFHSNDEYRGTAYQFTGPWDYGIRQGYPDTSQDLQRAMDQNPTMKVMLCCGRYDLACPYMGMRYTMAHLGEAAELAKNIHFEYYLAGHMMYIDSSCRQKLAKDVSKFVEMAANP